jgi:hypothetical protein
VATSQTCRLLYQQSVDDQLWRLQIQRNCPGSTIETPAPFASYRDFYTKFHDIWFLTRGKIWFSTSWPHGNLLFARFDPRIGAIEGYQVSSERQSTTFQHWDQHPDVIIHTFSPMITLDFANPLLHIDAKSVSNKPKISVQDELPMEHNELNKGSAATMFSHLIFTRPWPRHLISNATTVWPPTTIPSQERTQVATANLFNGLGHKPSKRSEVSKSSFRIRRWVEFTAPSHGLRMRIGEEVTTWATLPAEVYTPTASKPWRGIWCGDYAGHGCEFLVILQPDDPLPLPEGARAALERARSDSFSSDGSWETAPTGQSPVISPIDDDEETDAIDASVATLRPSTSNDYHQSCQYSGRLEAVKLTGDPNIPRGEYTFIAPDIGDNGLIRIANEEIFKGARIVRSVGHIAAQDYRNGRLHISIITCIL